MPSIATVLPIDVMHLLVTFLSSSLIMMCHRVCKTFCAHMMLTKLDEELMTRIITNGGIDHCQPHTVRADLADFLKNMPRFKTVTEIILPGEIRMQFIHGPRSFYYSWIISRNLFCEAIQLRAKIVYDVIHRQCSIFMYHHDILSITTSCCHCRVPQAFVPISKTYGRQIIVDFVIDPNIPPADETEQSNECTMSEHSFERFSQISVSLRRRIRQGTRQ